MPHRRTPNQVHIHVEEDAIEATVRDLERLAQVVKDVFNGRLSERALVLLVWDSLPTTKRPSREVVQAVLRAFAGVAGRYIVKSGDNLAAHRHVDVGQED